MGNPGGPTNSHAISEKEKETGVTCRLVLNLIVFTCKYSLPPGTHEKPTKILSSKSQGRDIYHNAREKLVEGLCKASGVTDDKVQSRFFPHTEHPKAISQMSFAWHSRSSKPWQELFPILSWNSLQPQFPLQVHVERAPHSTLDLRSPVMGSSVEDALHSPLHVYKCHQWSKN